jgi:hypothetical protein
VVDGRDSTSGRPRRRGGPVGRGGGRPDDDDTVDVDVHLWLPPAGPQLGCRRGTGRGDPEDAGTGRCARRDGGDHLLPRQVVRAIRCGVDDHVTIPRQAALRQSRQQVAVHDAGQVVRAGGGAGVLRSCVPLRRGRRPWRMIGRRPRRAGGVGRGLWTAVRSALARRSGGGPRGRRGRRAHAVRTECAGRLIRLGRCRGCRPYPAGCLASVRGRAIRSRVVPGPPISDRHRGAVDGRGEAHAVGVRTCKSSGSGSRALDTVRGRTALRPRHCEELRDGGDGASTGRRPKGGPGALERVRNADPDRCRAALRHVREPGEDPGHVCCLTRSR